MDRFDFSTCICACFKQPPELGVWMAASGKKRCRRLIPFFVSYSHVYHVGRRIMDGAMGPCVLQHAMAGSPAYRPVCLFTDIGGRSAGQETTHRIRSQRRNAGRDRNSNGFRHILLDTDFWTAYLDHCKLFLINTGKKC